MRSARFRANHYSFRPLTLQNLFIVKKIFVPLREGRGVAEYRLKHLESKWHWGLLRDLEVSKKSCMNIAERPNCYLRLASLAGRSTPRPGWAATIGVTLLW